MHIEEWIRKITWKRALYSCYALALLVLFAVDFAYPLGPLRMCIMGIFLLIPVTHLTVLTLLKLFDIPVLSLILPFLYWGVFYSGMVIFNQVGLAVKPGFFETAGIAIIGYFFMGLFVSPGIVLLLVGSIIGVVLAYLMKSRESRNIILGAMLLVHALTVYAAYAYQLILKT